VDENKSADQLFRERAQRVEDASHLTVPDRVPINCSFSYFPAKYAGLSCEDAFYNLERWIPACKKTILDFAPDSYGVQMNMSGPALDALGSKQILIPGHGTPANHCHQFVEDEYMKAEEFAAFLKDSSDYAVRVYTPRIYSKLKAFEKLPPLSSLAVGGLLGFIDLFSRPEFQDAIQAMTRAGEELVKWRRTIGPFQKEMQSLGFPSSGASTTWAPYEFMPDFLRGMKGAMLDLYRRPDQVLEACEKILPMTIEKGINGARKMGVTRVFIPLHRGSEGFMSLKQFRTFYWPTLKKLMLVLVDAGLTPAPFFEGDYTSRLESLLELPRGKVVGHFDTTDIFKAKEVLGGHMCIEGNMPASLLQTGTPEEIKAHAKKLIDVVGKNGGYIMACRSSMDEADPALVKVWVDFTKEYGVYR
jgi:hypothetical protein